MTGSALPSSPNRRPATDHRELLLDLLGSAPVGAGLLDPAGRFLWVNDTLAAMNGITAEQHVGRSVDEVVPALAAAVGPLLNTAVAGSTVADVEISGETPARPGMTRTWLETWYPLHRDGKVVAVAAVVVEVTDQRVAEQARAASDERLDLVLEAGGMGTWDWDLEADHIRWDARTASIFGVDLNEFDGSLATFQRLVHPDDVEPLTTAIEQAISSRDEFRREYRVVHPSGDTRWVSVRGRVVSDGPKPLSMVGVIQDRTDTHSLGEQLTRTLESIDEAFFSLDRQWRFAYVNARAEALLQRSRAELLGGSLWKLFPEAVGTTFHERYEAAMEDATPSTFEEYYEPLGIWVEVRVYPETAGIAVYFRDISARKAREHARQERLARQERAHAAAARLLDLAGRLRADHTPAEAAATACEVGVGVLTCSRASMWQISGGEAALLAQFGGGELAPSTRLTVADLNGWHDTIASEEPTFVGDAQATGSPTEQDIARKLGMHAVLQIPVRLSERAGALLILLSWDHVIDEPDVELIDVAQRFAQQSALALEQARHRQVQHEVTELSGQLQASLLPTPMLVDPTLDIGTLYRPGERRMVLGGDFYDVVEQADGSMSLVIGDVTGHGPEAAAIGASLRAGWRALAIGGAAVVDMITGLDALLRAERDSDEQLVSVCCAQISPDRTTITVASAGHPPPIVATPGSTAPLEAPSGLLLGLPVEDGQWGAVTHALSSPWAVLLYTDGLLEARVDRCSAERVGLERFVEHVVAADLLVSVEPRRLLADVQRTIRGLADQPLEDDVALLLVRCLSQDPGTWGPHS